MNTCALASLACAIVLSAPVRGVAQDSPEAFVPLFNGKDLSGWVNVNCAPSTFSVAKGAEGEPVIHCTGKPTGVIRTDKQYENFILELDFRFYEKEGNAGLFIWSDPLPAKGQPFTRAIEIQVMTGPDGDWYTCQGDVFPIHGATMTPENPRPNGGQRAYPTDRRMKEAPAWNHYRIECKDGSISHAVNGAVVTRAHNASPRKGYICLESEGAKIDFKNIRIHELPPSGTLTPEQTATSAEDFVPLYTGVDFAGWKYGKGHQKHWKASDWKITFDGQGEHLWTEKSYKDFVLIADWRWSGKAKDMQRQVINPDGRDATNPDGSPKVKVVPDAGDSGIYLRGSEKSQVNIWCWPIGSGEVYGYRTDKDMPAEVRAGVTPKMAADAPIGQWNRFEITMKGDRLTVVLNGKTVIEDARLPGVAAEGPIALQQHGAPIEFANLFIREIK